MESLFGRFLLFTARRPDHSSLLGFSLVITRGGRLAGSGCHTTKGGAEETRRRGGFPDRWRSSELGLKADFGERSAAGYICQGFHSVGLLCPRIHQSSDLGPNLKLSPAHKMSCQPGRKTNYPDKKEARVAEWLKVAASKVLKA